MRNLTRSFRRELPNAKTLSQKVAAILRKYGTDAHVYLPGIGVINGLTAGNYLDSAGTTAATVDNPVGLVVDSGGINAIQATTANKPILRRGAVNLLTYSEQFDNAVWAVTTGSKTVSANSVTSPNGTLTADTITLSNQFINQFVTVPVGTYTVSVYLKGSGSVSLRIFTNGFSNLNSTTVTLTDTWTRYSITGTMSGGNTIVGLGLFGTVTVDAWGAQLQTGSVATDYIPTTTAAASSNTGNYWWQFVDGTDYLSLGSAPWQISDNHCVIVGFNKSNTGVLAPLVTLSGAGSTIRAPSLQVTTSGYIQALWYDGTTIQSTTHSSSIYGVNKVASAIKIATAGRLRLNGVQVGTVTVNINPVSTGGAIGAFVDGSNGNGSTIYAVVGIKGTVSDADLLTLEKWVGQLSGVTI